MNKQNKANVNMKHEKKWWQEVTEMDISNDWTQLPGLIHKSLASLTEVVTVLAPASAGSG